jgi:hypothetical protein
VAVTEDHFVGYEPWTEFPPTPGCPRDKNPAYAIWFEKWSFTGWSWHGIGSSGIVYVYGYAVFNKLGEYLQNGPCLGGPPTKGFAGNETTSFHHKIPTNDEWLARARQRTDAASLPAPGTAFMLEHMTYLVGVRPG